MRRRSIKNGYSLSGHERNPLFLNHSGGQFFDVGGLSGLDHSGDSRAFVYLDYDRDGWQDIAVVNVTAPFFQLFRNQIAGRVKDVGKGQILALRFVGGNHKAEPSPSWSNRDGYGAMVTVTLDDPEPTSIKREHRAGEGFAAQNSATMIIGIGDHSSAKAIVVRWPSGRATEIGDVPSGTLVTVYENAAQSSSAQSWVLEPYKIRAGSQDKDLLITKRESNRMQLLANKSTNGQVSKLRMYTTMATWCVNCKAELPQLQRLRSEFAPEALGMYGIPVDKREGPDRLESYLDRYQPAYELLLNLPENQIDAVQGMVNEELKIDALPATIMTDGDGNVLKTLLGVPSVSEIRQMLAESGRQQGQRDRLRAPRKVQK